MTLQIIDCEQGSPEWFAARLGIPTASMFKTVQASGKSGGDSLTRKAYLYKLAGEIITDAPMNNYSNADMERGKELEPEARELYAFLHDDADLKQVGFIRNGNTGCSPDRLIGKAGILEIKTGFPHVIVDLIMRDKFPAEHVAQCQGNLWIAEREWIDLICYWPRMPLFVKRAHRDEAYIKTLAEAVDAFNSELSEIVGKVRGYGQPKPPKAHRQWSELSLPEQAGIRCNEVSFDSFLRARWPVRPEASAADFVREYCCVKSRAELGTDDAAAVRWIELNRDFERWLREPGG